MISSHPSLLAMMMPSSSTIDRSSMLDLIARPVLYGTIFLLLLVAHKILIAPRMSALRHIPGVPQEPLMRRLFKEPNSVDFLRWMEEVPNNGLLRYFGVLNAERVLVTTTQSTRFVHEGDVKIFHRPPAAKAILCRLTGGGLFAAEGRQHAAQRKEMSPAFKHAHLKDLYTTFWKKTVELVVALEYHLRGGEEVVDIDDWTSRGTLDAIGLAGFGFDFHSIGDPDSELVRKYRTAFLPSKSAARIRMLVHFIPTTILFSLPMRRNRHAKECIAAVRKTIREFVHERCADEADSRADRGDILGTLLSSTKIVDAEEVVSHCMSFLGAGHEASALALGWTLFELSKDTTRQQRLREEIRTNIASPLSGTYVDIAKVDGLLFLEAVIKESLRLWAPVPRRTRMANDDVVVSGQSIPAKTHLVLSAYAMNRSTRYWGPDAGQFKPERWMGDAESRSTGGSSDRYAFSTFSHGARNCIGQKFAHFELAVFLVGLVGRLEWRPDGPVTADHDSTVMLKFVDGLRLRARALPGW